jgi:pSer/pThr/pTyr-binding forkhead associated (FHA) protein
MPRLVIKKGSGVGRDHALGAGPCVVGRDPGATFVLEDTIVSRRHFKVVQEGGAYFVEDLGSTNGTLLNGSRTQRARLSDGDTIQIGHTRIQFVQKDLLGGARPGGAARPKPVAEPPPAPTRTRAPAPIPRRRRRR